MPQARGISPKNCVGYPPNGIYRGQFFFMIMMPSNDRFYGGMAYNIDSVFVYQEAALPENITQNMVNNPDHLVVIDRLFMDLFSERKYRECGME